MFRSFLVSSAILVAGTTVGGGISSAATRGGRQTSGASVVGSSDRRSFGMRTSQSVSGPPSALAVRIVHIDSGDVVLVNACIDGAGPFPFVIDSGSSFSVIDTQLARRFHLHQVGAPQEAAGIACSAPVVPEQLSGWSVGGLALRPQVVFSASLPNLEPNQPLAGVIGSDVLSRFGSVRIDYQKQTVSLGAAESDSPTADGVVRGPTSTPTPALFLKDIRAEAELTIVARRAEWWPTLRLSSTDPLHSFSSSTLAPRSPTSRRPLRALFISQMLTERRVFRGLWVPGEADGGENRPLGNRLDSAPGSVGSDASALWVTNRGLTRVDALPVWSGRDRLPGRPNSVRILTTLTCLEGVRYPAERHYLAGGPGEVPPGAPPRPSAEWHAADFTLPRAAGTTRRGPATPLGERSVPCLKGGGGGGGGGKGGEGGRGRRGGEGGERGGGGVMWMDLATVALGGG